MTTHEEALEDAVVKVWGIQWMKDVKGDDHYDSLLKETAFDLEQAISAYLEASGMVMVPREATFSMLYEGQGQVNLSETEGQYECLSIEEVGEIWSSMLAAFPSPFSQANTGEGK